MTSVAHPVQTPQPDPVARDVPPTRQAWWITTRRDGAPAATSLQSHAESLSPDARSRLTAELLAAAHASDDPAEHDRLLSDVVVVNCRIADAVAARYRDRGVPLEDLQQAACEGLVKAVQRFDPGHGKDLLTFAVPTIRGEVRRYFRDRCWMVRPPRRVQELQWRTNSVIDALVHELGREPTHAEVRAELGVDERDYTEAVVGFGCFRPSSLDQGVGEEGDATLGDLVADDADERQAAEARCMLGPVVRALGERERRVLHLRYFEGRTQREIGEEIGVTQMQVSRLLDRILIRLRADLEGASSSAQLPTPA